MYVKLYEYFTCIDLGLCLRHLFITRLVIRRKSIFYQAGLEDEIQTMIFFPSSIYPRTHCIFKYEPIPGAAMKILLHTTLVIADSAARLEFPILLLFSSYMVVPSYNSLIEKYGNYFIFILFHFTY